MSHAARRVTYTSAAAVLMLALLVGCSTSSPAPASTPSPTPTVTAGPTATRPASDDLWSIPAGFELERVVDGLHLPVNLAFVPNPGSNPEDPRYYILELYGTVKVVLNNGEVRTYADNLLNFDPTGRFPGSGEAGSIGIAVHPDTGDLFVSLAYQDPDITFGDGKLAFANKVVRMSSSDGGLSANRQTTLIDSIGPTATAHQIQAVTIGPDGMVYVNVGDGGRSDEDYNPAQDPADLRGKVLRMTPEGAIPRDNPDPDSYVYARGFRNPFGGAWRGVDSHLYVSDNGPAEHDRLVKVRPEHEYGWCCDMTAGAIHLWPRIVAPTAIDFMEGGQFPPEYGGHLFVASVGFTYGVMPWDNGKRIFDVTLDDVGNVRAIEDFLVYIGEGYSTVVGLAFGPDGLYFTDMYGEAGFDDQGGLNAGVYRVRWFDAEQED